MKKLYTLLAVAFIGFVGNAQIVNIPDVNFKAFVLLADTTNSIARDLSGNYFKIDANNDGIIQVSEAAQVTVLDVSNSSILDMTGLDAFTNLYALNCSNNQLSTLDLSQMVAGFDNFDIDCSHNQLTTITFPTLTGQDIGYIGLDNNLFETITLPNCIINDSFYCGYNPNLRTLNLKDSKGWNNGYFGDFYYISYCPNLEYICVREQDVSGVQSSILMNGYNCTVNTYCSFNPGGTVYTIQGATHYDNDNNGCDVADIIYPNLRLNFSDGTNTGVLISGISGNYSIPVTAGSYTITPLIENTTYYTISPTTAAASFPSQASPLTQYFCMAGNGIHNDLEVAMFPVFGARPGEYCYYKIIYKNRGTQTQNGTVSMAFDDSVLDSGYSTPMQTSQGIGTLSWDFSNLLQFETREILTVLYLHTPLATPPVNAGDILNYTVNITGVADETPSDNTSTLNQTVVNSFDPNDKTCIEGTTVTPAMVGQYVHYVVRFENDGTANAENIVVKDMIDTTKFDINSLIPLSGSASYVTRITNTNQVEFVFQNINLPFATGTNTGYVAFKIKTKPTLVVGDTFSNSANIYFDYNFPITTNTATTIIATLATQDFDFGTYFSVYPSPAKEVLNLQTKSAINVKSVNIYNLLGQMVIAIPNAESVSAIDVSNLKTGTYFIKLTTDKGTANTKFIKE